MTGLLGGYPSFGMSMRFSVEVEGLETPGRHLGLWHSCKGLQVDLNYEKLAEGGANMETTRLPEKVQYSAVTLERPVYEKSSKQVKNWLEDYIKSWNDYQTGPYSGTTRHPSVIITLLDYQLNDVMSWTLENACPSRWIGPELSATGNEIAMETLVIEHSGFLSHETRLCKASLRPAAGEDGPALAFQFNPDKITVEHASELGNQWIDQKGEITKLTAPSITVPDLRFDGPDTLDRCEKLLKWSYPHKGEGRTKYRMTPLIFEWGHLKAAGTGRIEAILTKAKIEYLRFDPDGKPIRAKAELTLWREDPGVPAQQNPTSGGLPGRSGHLMVSGDTMAGIALGTYGDPARWRAIAAANQVDDPLRVRPGAMLYLPAGAELAAGGAA